jgi:hypothetical protein
MGVPKSHADAQEKNRRGAASNLSVEEGKHAAATKDPGADRSRENVETAKRDWKGGN